MIRILEHEDYSEAAISIYKSLGNVTFGYPESVDEVSRVLVVRLGHYIGNQILRKMPNLRAVVTPTTGLNHIDEEALSKQSIHLLYLGDVRDKIISITSTPEHSLLLILGINRRLGLFMNDCSSGSGIPTYSQRERYKGKELSEQTLGILGTGRVGKRLISLSRSLFKEVVAWDIDREALKDLDVEIARDVQDLFGRSDSLCICIDYRPENVAFVSDSLMRLMPEAGCLVNTSRGEVVDEKAVLTHLRSGRLFGYATDVLSKEQSADLSESSILKGCGEKLNLLVTPHIGGCTSSAMKKTEAIMAERLLEMKECILE